MGASFDRVAPYYGVLERLSFGSALQRARCAFLDAGCFDAEVPRRALLVGEGEGRFACALQRRFPQAALVIVDSSPVQVARARSRLGGLDGVARAEATFLVRDVLADEGALDDVEACDFIATPFFLDCFEGADLAAVVARIAARAAGTATWVVSDFAPAGHGLGRLRRVAWQTLLYGFFQRAASVRARRVDDPSPLLERHGFELSARRDLRCGLLTTSLWRKRAQVSHDGTVL